MMPTHNHRKGTLSSKSKQILVEHKDVYNLLLGHFAEVDLRIQGPREEEAHPWGPISQLSMA